MRLRRDRLERWDSSSRALGYALCLSFGRPPWWLLDCSSRFAPALVCPRADASLHDRLARSSVTYGYSRSGSCGARGEHGGRDRATFLADAAAGIDRICRRCSLPPLVYFFVISFWSVRARIMRPAFSLKNYVETCADYGDVLGNTLLIAGVIAVLDHARRLRCSPMPSASDLAASATLFLLLTLITLFGGYLVKIYAWKSILGRDGVLNQALLGLGLIDAAARARCSTAPTASSSRSPISCCPSPCCRSTAACARSMT